MPSGNTAIYTPQRWDKEGRGKHTMGVGQEIVKSKERKGGSGGFPSWERFRAAKTLQDANDTV